MRAFINLMLNLPWWLDLAIVGVLIVFAFGVKIWFSRKFDQIVRETILEVGSVLRGAEVTVHAVEARPAPETPSPYDLDEDDENYLEGMDGEAWNEPFTNFYWIDVTISPVNPAAEWDPTSLALVPADFEPEDPTDACLELCPLHSAEILVDGRFEPADERAIRGAQRLHMLYAVHEGITAAKFGMFTTYFGHIDLPVPKAVSRT